MVSGGQTKRVKVTDIGLGRQLLCREKPATRPTSACSKQLIKTVKAVKRGLTAKQQKLWSKYVYTPAMLQVWRYAAGYSSPARTDRSYRPPPGGVDLFYVRDVRSILDGKRTFKDLYGKAHKWADYLLKGAKLIKKTN